MVILGIDFGDARTGVAACDEKQILCFPCETVPSYNTEKLLERISAIANERHAEKLVVGLPLALDGTEGERAEHVRILASKLSEICSLPVDFFDERFTTSQAYRFVHMNGKNHKNSRNTVDQTAAVIILEDYIKKSS